MSILKLIRVTLFMLIIGASLFSCEPESQKKCRCWLFWQDEQGRMDPSKPLKVGSSYRGGTITDIKVVPGRGCSPENDCWPVNGNRCELQVFRLHNGSTIYNYTDGVCFTDRR